MHDDYAPAGVAAPLEIPIAEEDIIVKSGHLTTPRINVVIKKFSAVVKKGRAGYLWEVAGIFDGDVDFDICGDNGRDRGLGRSLDRGRGRGEEAVGRVKHDRDRNIVVRIL